MSCIKKMSVQGIRSFGPDDDNKQLITFFTPLTLILGPNGTGKTTIIECLKYITTGDMPPNAGKGGSFVHDPKIARDVDVRGQVKLQMTDVMGQQVTVTRSLQVTQKQKQVQMKTLDGTVVKEDKSGKKTSITSKCADLNKEMTTFLGVSRAILNYVIFCHQEESNWPLSEGKALKKKFDDIFAATRYIKALENFHKIRLEMEKERQVAKAVVPHLKNNKEQAAKWKKNLDETQTRCLQFRDTVKGITAKLAPVEQKLRRIADQQDHLGRVHCRKVEKQAQLIEMEKAQEELRLGISDLFAGSVEELKVTFDEFVQNLRNKQRSLKQMDQEKQKGDRELSSFNIEKNKYLQLLGKLKNEAEQQQERIRSRDTKLVSASHQFDLGASITDSHSLREPDIRKILQLLNDKISVTCEEDRQLKARFENEERELQRKVDSVRDSKTRQEQSIQMKKDQMSNNKGQLREIERDLREVDTSAAKLKKLDGVIYKAETELQSFEGKLDVSKEKDSISSLKETRTRLETDLRKLDDEMGRIHSQSGVQAKLEILKNDKRTKEEVCKKVLARHEDVLLQLFGQIPSENIRDRVENENKKLKEDVKNLTSKLQNLKLNLSTAESHRKQWLGERKKKEDEIKGFEEKLFQTCGSEDFDSDLEKLQKAIKDMQLEQSTLLGTTEVYNKFVNKLKDKDPCCPLCRRDFEEQQDVVDLVGDIEAKLQIIPGKLKSREKQMTENEKKHNLMLELRPVKTQMEKMKSVEVPALKEKVKIYSDQVEEFKKDLTEVEEDCLAKQLDEAMTSSMMNDMITLDQAQRELQRLNRDIASITSRLGSETLDRTMEEVKSEKDIVQHELDKVKHDVETRQEKVSEYTDRCQTLRQKLNDLKSEQLQAQTLVQQYQKLKDKKAELIQDNEKCETSIQELMEQKKQLESKLAQAEQAKKDMLMKKEVTSEQSKNSLDTLQQEQRDIQTITTEIERYVRDGKEALLTETSNTLQTLDQKMTKLESSVKSCVDTISCINNEMSAQQNKKRELEDNMKLREKEKEIDEIKKELEDLEKELGGIDVSTLNRDKNLLESEMDELKNKQSQARGREQELEKTIRGLKSDLEQEDYKNADTKFKEKIIDLRTTEITIGDLKKYYNALDRAIMRYHSLKMSEINKIVRELWMNTYRGKDIDFIQIQSNDSETTGDKRRIYNYKVVMVKGGAELDMRGRCSAGQKVLASLIIRLALAETFCTHCGIIALDEPTTNLDRDNIESLATALIEIVKSRQGQTNFQLVVITHDEDFIQMLGNSDFAEYIYRVNKNDRGLSELKKIQLSAVR